MFQPCFVDLISVLSEIVVGISAVVAIIAGIFGFRKWRTELRDKVGLELALKIALLAQEFRDKFNWVRNPLTYRSEIAERQKGDHETNERDWKKDAYFAKANRLRSLQETVTNLRVARWEAELILDEGIGKLIEPIEGAFRELSKAINEYFSFQLEASTRTRREAGWDSTRDRSVYLTVYSMPGDEFGESVDDAVNALLEELKRHIKR